MKFKLWSHKLFNDIKVFEISKNIFKVKKDRQISGFNKDVR